MRLTLVFLCAESRVLQVESESIRAAQMLAVIQTKNTY